MVHVKVEKQEQFKSKTTKVGNYKYHNRKLMKLRVKKHKKKNQPQTILSKKGKGKKDLYRCN